MLPMTEALGDLTGTIALAALVAIFHGPVLAADRRPWMGRLLLGALLGVVAALAGQEALSPAPGLSVSLGALPVALAAAYAGPQGLVAAMVVAAASLTRMGGVEELLAGGPGLLAAGLLGLLWARLGREAHRRGAGARLGLAAMTAVPWGALLPSDLVGNGAAQAWPVLIPAHALGVLVAAALFEREAGLVASERRRVHAGARDALTGLLNRRGFGAAAIEAGRRGGGAALLLVGVDDFEATCGREGPAAGDAVLREVARRLGAALRERDVVARFGRAEFAVFLPSVVPRGAEDAARRIGGALRARPVAVPDGPEVAVTISVGVAWTGDRPDLGVLLARADAELCRARAQGGGRCSLGAMAPEDDEFGAVMPEATRPEPTEERLAAA